MTKKNLAESVHTRLVRLAKERGEDPQLVLMRYVAERLLHRLGESPLRDEFTLKGAMLLTALIPDAHRATKDLDFLGRGAPDAERVAGAFRTIVATPVEADGLRFVPESVSADQRRVEEHYPGVQLKLTAELGPARVPVKIDVGFGDAITPRRVLLTYPTLLPAANPRVHAYPVETVVSEKFEAMCSRALLNSRLKDYWDLSQIARHLVINGATLAAAIRATFMRRGTQIPSMATPGLTPSFAAQPERQRQWTGFLRQARLDPEIRLDQVVEDVARFVMPVSAAAARGETFERTWEPGKAWDQGPERDAGDDAGLRL